MTNTLANLMIDSIYGWLEKDHRVPGVTHKHMYFHFVHYVGTAKIIEWDFTFFNCQLGQDIIFMFKACAKIFVSIKHTHL